MPFKKLSKEQRDRIKARRADERTRFLHRISEEAAVCCFSYVAFAKGAPSKLQKQYVAGYLTGAIDADGTRYSATSYTLTPVTKNLLIRKIQAFQTACAPRITARRALVRALIGFATCDAPVSPEQQEAIDEIGELLHVSRESRRASGRVWKVEKKPRKNPTTKDQTKGRSKASIIERAQSPSCYAILGCSESDSDETIKRTYRLLARQLHPDKHAAHTKTSDEAAKHVRAFQQLQQAYEEIQRLRANHSPQKPRER